MRLIRIQVEKVVTCSTTVVSCWRRNNFISSSLTHRTLPDTSESSLAEELETSGARCPRFSMVHIVKLCFELCIWVYRSTRSTTTCTPILSSANFRRCTPYVTFNIQRDVLLAWPTTPLFHAFNLRLDKLLDLLRRCRPTVESFF